MRNFLHAEPKELARIFTLLVFRDFTRSELDWLCDWVSDNPKYDIYDNNNPQSVIDWMDTKRTRVSIPNEEWAEVQYMAQLAKMREGEL